MPEADRHDTNAAKRDALIAPIAIRGGKHGKIARKNSGQAYGHVKINCKHMKSSMREATHRGMIIHHLPAARCEIPGDHSKTSRNI